MSFWVWSTSAQLGFSFSFPDGIDHYGSRVISALLHPKSPGSTVIRLGTNSRK